MESNVIIQGDCLEVMRGMDDNCVDLVLTDPPYGIGLEYDQYDDTEKNWYNLMSNFIPEACRIAKMVILPSCQINRLDWIYTNYPPDWLICWYKGSPGTLSFVGFNDWEPHLVYGKTKGTQMHDHFQTKASPKMGSFGHPCPKPIEWANWLISRATKEGDTVLDCFAGSGTTCVAAKMLNRNYIGIDLSANYCQIANDRIECVDSGISLKEKRKGQMPLWTK